MVRTDVLVGVACCMLAGEARADQDPVPVDGANKLPSAIVSLANGSSLSAHDLTFDSSGTVRARSEVGPLVWRWDEILSISVSGVESRLSRHPALLLAGGERLHGEIAGASEETVDIKSELAEAISLPLASVEGILVAERLPARTQARTIERLRTLPRSGDVFLLSNGDLLTGTISKFGPDQWTIEVEGKPRTVESNRLTGVALDPRLIETPSSEGLSIWARWSDGSLVAVREMAVNDGKCTMKLRSGPTVSVAWTTPPGPALVRLDVRGGRVRYLSELDPVRETKQPFLDAPVVWSRDTNAEGEPIRLGTRTFEHGLGMRSRTELEYDVSDYERFLATIGMDASAGEQAGAVFRVLGDGKSLFESDLMSLTTSPREIDVPLEGIKRLTLVVDFGPRGDMADLANWADARFVRRPTSSSSAP